MNDQELLKKAIEIVDKYNFSKYIKVITDYWSQNPPTCGHGFLHVVQVAVEAYTFGKDNNYDKPEYLFLGGLFHDIYRPAEGKHGEEDQIPGADVVKTLFEKNNLDLEAMELIIQAIKSHDDWREQDNPPLFDLYLSLGDKAAHTSLLTDSYVWINNRKRVLVGKNPVYSNHLQTLTSFYKYQLRAWDIMMKNQHVKGVERCTKRYIDIVKSTISRYETDVKGTNFDNLTTEQKDKTKQLEIEYLKAFKIDKKIIDKILQLYDL